MLAMGLPLRPVNTPLAGVLDFGWDFAGWPVHTTVTTSAMTRSEVGTIIPPALCRCDGHALHLRARLRAIIPHRQENGANPRDIRIMQWKMSMKRAKRLGRFPMQDEHET